MFEGQFSSVFQNYIDDYKRKTSVSSTKCDFNELTLNYLLYVPINACKLINSTVFNYLHVTLILSCKVYETSGFGSGRRLAELYAPIPESSVTSQSVLLENIEFSTYEKIAFDHEGVGSGKWQITHFLCLIIF